MQPFSLIPDRTWAVAALVLFAAAGAAVADDYGVPWDEPYQRQLAFMSLEYALGDDRRFAAEHHNQYYGMGFELPLLLAERALGLDGSRTIFLFRHYAAHLFWLCGGFACFLLARRLFGGGPLALLAMLLFLLQPRLYAHSFFNSKDVPFLSMFMIALYLIHRAFEKDTVRAFVVLGMGTAVLTNLRIMGVMLVVAVLGMRACDLLCAARWSERRRVLKTAGAFAAACAVTLYAISPYLWSNPHPREFAEALRTLSHHPTVPFQLFQGRMILSDDLPWRYVPTWVAITTPPFTLLLGCVGVAGVAWRVAARPGRALRNTPLRFGLLLTACLTAPPVAVAALGAHAYDNWRHLYFLHAPLALLAASGLRLLASRDAAWVRRGTYAAAGVAAAGILIAMIRIHPLQYVYFNFLVDRTTPEHLRMQYAMDLWHIAVAGGMRHLVQTHPSTNAMCVMAAPPLDWVTITGRLLLPEAQRKRIHSDACRSDFVVTVHRDLANTGIHSPKTYAPTVWVRKAYSGVLVSMYGTSSAFLDGLPADRFRETYRSLTKGAPAARAHYDVYFDAARNALTYARAPCVSADMAKRFFLHVIPVDVNVLPDHRDRDNLDFDLPLQALFEGKCLVTVRLPEYAVDHVWTGQTEKKNDVWTALWGKTIRIR